MAAPYDDSDAMLDEVIDVNESDESEVLRVERERAETATVRDYVAGIPAFELMSSSQIVSVDRYVHHKFDLSSDEFVINRYGLPFIPVPFPRRVNNSSRYRALPKHLSGSAIAGHPIYWTDREVLGDIPSKTNDAYAQEWSIRMFSFLLLCGFYTQQYTYRDYLTVKNVSIVDDNGEIDTDRAKSLRTYLEGLGAATEFDDVEYLSYDSIVVEPEKRGFSSKRELFEDFADSMVAKCHAVLDNATRKMHDDLMRVLAESDKFLFQDSGSGGLSMNFDDRHSHWDIHYSDHYFTVLDDYVELIKGNGYSQALEGSLREYSESIERSIIYMDNLSSSLISPILASGKKLSEESLAALQSYNRLAVDTAARRERYTISIRDVMLAINPEVNFNPDPEDDEQDQDEQIKNSKTYKTVEDYLFQRRDAYQDAWNRLFLCRANYDQALDAQPLFTTFESAQWQISQNITDDD